MWVWVWVTFAWLPRDSWASAVDAQPFPCRQCGNTRPHTFVWLPTCGCVFCGPFLGVPTIIWRCARLRTGGDGEGDTQEVQGTGMGEGDTRGAKDVSDKIENEDQLLGAQQKDRPEEEEQQQDREQGPEDDKEDKVRWRQCWG